VLEGKFLHAVEELLSLHLLNVIASGDADERVGLLAAVGEIDLRVQGNLLPRVVLELVTSLKDLGLEVARGLGPESVRNEHFLLVHEAHKQNGHLQIE